MREHLSSQLRRPAGAPGGELVVERFGPERGLAVLNVTAIHQDRAGFLWIGTRQGLILYDGSTARTFEHDIGDPGSIADNYVRTVYEDREGNLWIGTNSHGLERLDRARWSFEHHPHDSTDDRSISHDSVNVVFEDSRGTLWVGTQIGLNRFDRATGRFERILSDPDDPASLAHDYVYDLLEDRQGALWVATVGGGLDRLDASGRFHHHRHDPDDPGSIASDRVFALAADAHGQVWVATQDGLDRLDPLSGRFTHVPIAGPDGGEGLSDPLVTSIAIDPEGVLWAGTWGGAVDRLDTATGRFLPSLAAVAPELTGARVAALEVDRSGAVWIGTWAQGMLRSRRPAVPSRRWTTASGLAFDDVTAVEEDEQGALWVGTWGAGLDRLPPGADRFDTAFHERLSELAEGTVLAIESAGDGGVWVGTMGPLFRIGPDGSLAVYAHDPARADAIGAGYVTAVLRDSDGRIWAGLGGSGLYRLHTDGEGFEAFRHDPSDPGTLSDDYVTCLVEDHQGVLWVGTRSGGVNALDRASGRVERFLPDPTDPRALSFHYVTSMAIDERGALWIATAGGGLAVARRGEDGVAFERYGEADGLIDDTIRSLAVDGEVVWLATAHGLTRFDTARGRFDSFDLSDGLPTGGFNGNAATAGREAIYFGGAHGLLAIPRGLPVQPVSPAPTVLRSVRDLEGTLRLERPAWRLDRLEVPYGEILSFAFAVLDYGDPRRHRFAYRLAGWRDAWIELGDRREVTFTDLDPGTYRLEVRGRSSHGVWSRAPGPLELVVVPPLWMTPWFRLALLVVIVGGVVGAHWVRTSALERRNRELLALKEARERALEESRQSRERLHEAYDRLRRLTRRLEAAKEDERRRIARELHDEMGQALTAAKINLELIASVPAAPEIGDRAADTIELIDRMIQRVRALSLDLRPPLLDELGLAPALTSYLEAQAQRSGLEIALEGNGIPGDLPAEMGIAVFRFVQEAVTNVIRHAEARTVRVRIAHAPMRVAVSVIDDGRGFEVESTLWRATRGAHLGLLGARERVESLGGRLEIRSEPGRGTSVEATIPWPGAA